MAKNKKDKDKITWENMPVSSEVTVIDLPLITEELKHEELPLAYHLVVKSQFRKYRRGDRIFDRSEIEAIQSCYEKNMTTKVSN